MNAIENGNYPDGSQYSSQAPWNKRDLPAKKFQVVCSQSLSKSSTVTTDKYLPIVDKENKDITFVDYDTSNINWEEEYHLNCHYTPIQLIELFQNYLLDEVNGSNTVSRSNKYLNWLITECNNWIEDETTIVED